MILDRTSIHQERKSIHNGTRRDLNPKTPMVAVSKRERNSRRKSKPMVLDVISRRKNIQCWA